MARVTKEAMVARLKELKERAAQEADKNHDQHIIVLASNIHVLYHRALKRDVKACDIKKYLESAEKSMAEISGVGSATEGK